MFDNIGFGELLVIALFILIFFGPKKIPDIARTLGKAVREFRKAMQDVQSEIQSVTGIDLNETSETISKPLEKDDLDDLKFVKSEGENLVDVKQETDTVRKDGISKKRSNSTSKRVGFKSTSSKRNRARSGVKTKAKRK